MGVELLVARELSTLCVTLTETSSITRIIGSEIRNKDFCNQFNKILDNLCKSYDVVIANLNPLAELDSEESFVADFDERFEAYRTCYLKEISKPRAFSDNAYEDYLVMRTLKESKTGYPLLKKTFERFDEFIDKWVTNDAWLAMSVDNLFKMLNRLLNEIAEIKRRDPTDAYLLYSAAFAAFNPYLALIRQKTEPLAIV